MDSDDADVDVGKLKVPSNASIDDLLDSITEGKEVKGDIFETIKSVAKDGVAGVDVVAETAPPKAAAGGEPVTFECPVCGASVAEDSRSCPSCGAEFADEPVEQFECPSCGSSVDAAATVCPSCGVTFATEHEVAVPAAAPVAPAPPPPPAKTTSAPPAIAEVRDSTFRNRLAKATASRSGAHPPAAPADRRALYKELPRLVNEVKPMLLSARKIGVDIEEPKRLINDAIAAGKKREIDRAVSLVSQSKTSLERSFTVQIAGRVESLIGEVEKARAGGAKVGPVQTLLEESLARLEAGDFVASSDRANAARDEFEKLAGGYHRAKEGLRGAEALAEDGRVFGLELRDAERYIRQGREALGHREYERASRLSEQAKGAIMKVLPDFLNEEMKRARNKLLDMKMRGGDLTRMIGILKQASIHLKREEYGEAMRYVRQFRRETESR